MGKTRYLSMTYYHTYLDKLKKRKEDFELSGTNYTKKIKTKRKCYIFNENGSEDIALLYLINSVRRDAKNYLKKHKAIKEEYINFYNLVDKPDFNNVIYKVDLKGAYWNFALQNGIITKKTHDTFIESFGDLPYGEAKHYRLKALGSLATTKKSIQYINGKADYNTEIIYTEPTKLLYMEICRGIDTLMKECVEKVPGCFYYYWDCIFINGDFPAEAVNFFKERDYEVSIDKTRISAETVGRNMYLVTEKDGKQYMVRKEYKHLIEDI